MQSDWQAATVGAVSLVVTKGTTPTTLGHAFQDAGINFVKVESISPDGRFIVDKLVRISKEAHEALARSKLAPNDVLFTIAGTIGRTAIVTDEILPANTNQAVAIVRPNTALVHPRFLRYVLSNPAFLSGALSRTVESVQANFSLGELKSASILLPNLREQQVITEVLGAIDDRIDLIRQTNVTLESIAQALFKSWFIDFDPVRAKAEGHEPDGMDAATAALFPAAFDESELGPVPKGWTVQPIGDLVEAVGGSTPDTKNEAFWKPAVNHWTSPKDLSGATAPVLLDTERKVSDAGLAKISSGLLPVGTLLMSSRAPIGYLSLSQVPVAINQGYIAMPPGGRLPPVYLYFWCKLNMETIKGRANGSTFMEISKKAFRPIPALLPSPEVVSTFHEFSKEVFSRITSNERQARTLAELRDALLPRLISGKLQLQELRVQGEVALA